MQCFFEQRLRPCRGFGSISGLAFEKKLSVVQSWKEAL